MNKAIITKELVDRVLCLIEENTSFRKDSIAFEIQDNFQHLLISISIDNFSETISETGSVFKKLGQLLNSIMPSRRDHYSWMLVFTKAGKVVDSYFGGNLDSPNSGL